MKQDEIINELPKKSTKEMVKSGVAIVSEGTNRIFNTVKSGLKKGAIATKEGVAKGAEYVKDKGKSAQIAVANFIDTKKNKMFLDAKLSAFEDGLKEGKIEASEYIKKYANYCLAATALSYYFAKCDGSISNEEMLEIRFDLDSILKNKDLPDALKNEMFVISDDPELSFDKVQKYLDGVSLDTLNEFKNDVDEIIFADGIVSSEETEAKLLFDTYLQSRVGEHRDE